MASDSHAKRPIVVERRKEKGRKKTPRLTKTYDVKIIPATVGVVAETEEPPKKRVAACTACYAIFPKEAISMVEDEEGFEYPKIDENKCVHCYQCIKVCPIKVARAQ